MKPFICNYYVTYRCNARCGFCAIWKDRNVPSSQEAPADVVCRNLTDIKRAGTKFVDFTGGEPLLYEGLPEVLDFAKKAGLRTTVTTNGICYPDRAADMAGKVDVLQFSLDSANAREHDAVKCVPSFDSVMESVETARSLGERPSFIHTVTDENLSSVPDVIQLARSLKVPLFINPCFSYPGNRGLSREGAVKLGALARGKGVMIDRGFLRFFIDGGNRCGNPRCLAVSSTIVISPDDKLIIPCFHYKTRELPIGGKLLELLASDEVINERRNEGRQPFCEGCTVYCYMRASLFRKFDRYFLPTILSAAKYTYEYYLSQPSRKSV
ncbi:MAG: radical SAM protein [Candidatus Latescibacteria bacterium]|jgi:MoaA/NifB/PqqE/SkfB family radical SAM enzyme|nr:radical SAM protein [Candidatus Latescibacterota bacterium]